MTEHKTAKTIFVVSDSTGETAERVVRASLQQFPDHPVNVRVCPRITSGEEARQIIDKAAKVRAMVVFTLVSPELRDFVHKCAMLEGLEAVDVIGALINKTSEFLDAVPLNTPRASVPLTEDYFRRVAALDFAVKNDDGKEPGRLVEADVVLVGVSRTSKTPLSMYLAGRGLKVANVPLVLGVQPPSELFEVNPERVVGLTILLEPLLRMRRDRLAQYGLLTETEQTSKEQIEAELEFARTIFDQNRKWMLIDVTGKAVEETATMILESFKERQEHRNIKSLPPPLA